MSFKVKSMQKAPQLYFSAAYLRVTSILVHTAAYTDNATADALLALYVRTHHASVFLSGWSTALSIKTDVSDIIYTPITTYAPLIHLTGFCLGVNQSIDLALNESETTVPRHVLSHLEFILFELKQVWVV